MIFNIVRHYGVSIKIVQMTEDIHHRSHSTVWVNDTLSKELVILMNVCQENTVDRADSSTTNSRIVWTAFP